MIIKLKGAKLFHKPQNLLRIKGSQYASLAGKRACRVLPQAMVSVNVYDKIIKKIIQTFSAHVKLNRPVLLIN